MAEIRVTYIQTSQRLQLADYRRTRSSNILVVEVSFLCPLWRRQPPVDDREYKPRLIGRTRPGTWAYIQRVPATLPKRSIELFSGDNTFD